MPAIRSLGARARIRCKLPQMNPRLLVPLLLPALAGLVVSACRRDRPQPVVMTVARGTAPSWSVAVRSDGMQFTRLGIDSSYYPYTPPDFDADGRAVYRSKRFGADPLFMLVIERADCNDGTSEQRYPGKAVLTRGDSTWLGCATVVPDSLDAR